jgi:hypothetical protein
MTRILDMSSCRFRRLLSQEGTKEKKCTKGTVHVVLGACVYLVPIRSQQQTDRRRARLARLFRVAHKRCARKDSVFQPSFMWMDSWNIQAEFFYGSLATKDWQSSSSIPFSGKKEKRLFGIRVQDRTHACFSSCQLALEKQPRSRGSEVAAIAFYKMASVGSELSVQCTISLEYVQANHF